MKTKKRYSPLGKTIKAANLCLNDYNINKTSRRICMLFLGILLAFTIAAIV